MRLKETHNLPLWGGALLLLALLLLAFVHEIIAFALVGIGGAFLGFYISEIARKAIRARHVADQAYGYAMGTSNQFTFEQALEKLDPKVEAWISDRNSAIVNRAPGALYESAFLEIDKVNRDVLLQELSSEDALERQLNHCAELMRDAGRLAADLVQTERGLEGLKDWPESLPDEDVTLLGSEALFHYLQLRGSMTMALISHLRLCLYIKEADLSKANNDYLQTIFVQMATYLVIAQVELRMLIPLLTEIRKKSLFDLSLNLMGLASLSPKENNIQ